MIDTAQIELDYSSGYRFSSLSNRWNVIPDLLAEVKRLREELALYEKYVICHPDGEHCCDECLERNGFEVKQ